MSDYYQLSREIAHLSSAYTLVHWDFETQMPKGTAEWRGETMSFFAGLLHEKTSSASYLAAAESAHAAATDPVEKEALRKAVRDIKKRTLVPQKLVEELTEATARAHGAWQKAKKENNYAEFAPHLETIIRLTKEQARCIAEGKDPYDALLEEFSPGMSSATVSALFGELRPKLQALIEKRRPAHGLSWSVPVAVQEKICHDVIDWMKFPREFLTAARSVHPFCTSLHPSDVRITTRYDENDPLMSLLSTVHELGHALYERQLPTQAPGTPLAQANGMDLHESQSRLWEVCLATSPAFYRWVHAWYQQHAPEHLGALSADDLFRMGSEVKPSLIRTESDPVSYGMHIMIRFELERAIFDGKLGVQELPAAWASAYEKYLGVMPRTLAEGVLQDSHWPGGAFGYFPSYLLGTMIACQLFEAMEKEFPDLMARVERGDVAPFQQWLAAKVHRYGRGKDTQDILLAATGKKLETAPFLNFLQARFFA